MINMYMLWLASANYCMIPLALRKIKPLSRIPVLPVLLNPGLTECEDGGYPDYLKTKRYSCRIEGKALRPFTVLRVKTIDCRKTASGLQGEQRFMEKAEDDQRDGRDTGTDP